MKQIWNPKHFLKGQEYKDESPGEMQPASLEN